MAKKIKNELEIIKMYEEGFSSLEVGKHFGINDLTVRNILRRNGRNVRKYTGAPFKNLKKWRQQNPDYQNGDRNPSWKSGACRSTIRRIAKKVLDQANIDQNTCQSCGHKSDTRLNIHHKDHNRLNNILENLEVLCVVCHNSGSKSSRHSRSRRSDGTFK